MVRLTLLVATWLLVGYHARSRRPALLAWAAVSLVALGLLALPGRPYSEDGLRQAVVGAWRGYDGTRYIWGGENRLGIDCSGLVRRGLIDATWRVGLRTLNPRLIRASCRLAWHDCSARALGENHNGVCRGLGAAASLNTADERLLLPGDLAVTASGVHTLGYLGDGTWIQAEPGAGRVIIEHAPGQDPWFDMPVTLHRWSLLATPPGGSPTP
ncbi:MAG: C40 family peptidase [Armatimonadetes bacterium]|nr:C40 family peptidase [Armatimonadota bacterium]